MSTHDFASPATPSEPRAGRAARVGTLIAAALALHALVLGGADWVWPSTAPPPLPAASLAVRVLEPAPLAAPEPVDAAAPPRTPALASLPTAAPKPMVPARAARIATQKVSATAVERAAPAPSLPAPAPSPPAPPPTDEEAIPLYAVQLPPPATLRYELSRGALHGTGGLVWRPQGDVYTLTLDFKLAGLTILSQSSTGSIDLTGIAPQRFTDQRPRRGTTAANFRREAAKISYSGSASEFALRPGAQDRLSWMLQLAAIVSADPQLAASGARIAMQVTGSHGDAGVWVFRCLGVESIDARGGAIAAVKYLREPRELYDTTVQVWLDPAQHHLPVRATQKSGANDEGYELRLLEVSAPG